MAHVNPVRPNIPLLGSGVVSLILGAVIPAFAMDFSHPDMTFAFLAMAMLLFGIYGIVGTLAGLASVIPGVAR